MHLRHAALLTCVLLAGTTAHADDSPASRKQAVESLVESVRTANHDPGTVFGLNDVWCHLVWMHLSAQPAGVEDIAARLQPIHDAGDEFERRDLTKLLTPAAGQLIDIAAHAETWVASVRDLREYTVELGEYDDAAGGFPVRFFVTGIEWTRGWSESANLHLEIRGVAKYFTLAPKRCVVEWENPAGAIIKATEPEARKMLDTVRRHAPGFGLGARRLRARVDVFVKPTVGKLLPDGGSLVQGQAVSARLLFDKEVLGDVTVIAK